MIKKVKLDTYNAIKSLESKIDFFDKEFTNLTTKNGRNNSNEINVEKKICKYYSRGFCKNLDNCLFRHPEKVCEMFEIFLLF